MPSIDKFSVKPTSKKFKKTAYRPWSIIEGKETDTISTTRINNSPGEAAIEAPALVSPILNSSKDVVDRTHEDKFDYKSISNQITNGYKPVINQKVINKEPIDNHKETDFQIDCQSIGNQISNQTFNVSTPNTNLDFDEIWSVEKAVYQLSRLIGLQKKIILYIGTLCITKNDLSSGPISTQELKQLLHTDSDTIKTATQRLVTKKFVCRELGKRGTGGFSLFRIQESLKQAIILDIQKSQMSGMLVTNLEPKKEPKRDSINSSSSNLNISINTTTQNRENWLPTEWQQIAIQPLEEIGFCKSHLAQIYKFGLLSPEIVQDSINAFSFDLQINDKAQKIKNGSPLNYFMGVMKNGMPYAPSENYEAPDVRAYRIYVERKKIEKKRKENLEREAFELAFNSWFQDLTEDVICQIIPEPSYRRPDSPLRQGALELYFRNNHWVNFVKEIRLGGNVEDLK